MRQEADYIVSTVRGPRPVSDLGITLSHEHVAIDTTPRQRSANRSAPRLLLDYTSEDAVAEALFRYKQAGGSTIVEATPDGCGRNPLKLREISERLDLNIICATGWYREENYPDHVLALAASGRTDLLLRELAVGIADTGIRPGIIKVGTSATITREEEITLRAAARAQREAGVGLAIHVTNVETDSNRVRLVEMPAAHRALDIIEHEGAELGRVSLCHSDGTYLNSSTAVPLHLSLLKRGVYLSFDQFALNPIPEPGISTRPADDAERIRTIVAILDADESYLRQLLLSQDVSSHEQLAVARGSAYSHLLTSVCPQLREAGLTTEQVNILLRGNPAAFVGTRSLPAYTYRDPVAEFGKSAWYWHRSVRTMTDSGGLYFSPEHVPVLQDEAMRGLRHDEIQRLLAIHLATLLKFTAWLELNPVLQVCRSIFEGRFSRLTLPEPTRQIALRIMTDEVSHTDLCFEYLRELERTVSIPDIDVEGVSARRLQSFVEMTPDGFRDIALLAYVLVSETTITAALDVAPRDERVRPQIRELLRDHADDERRHQEYFSSILRSLWLATPAPDRSELALLLTRAMEVFLSPDSSILEVAVASVSPDRAIEIVERVMRSPELLKEMRTAAEPLMRVLRDVGAFHEPDVVQVFLESFFEFDPFALEASNQ